MSSLQTSDALILVESVRGQQHVQSSASRLHLVKELLNNGALGGRSFGYGCPEHVAALAEVIVTVKEVRERIAFEALDELQPVPTEYFHTGVEMIAQERSRQIQKEGYTAENDDGYNIGQLCNAAACYLVAGDCLANGPEMMGEKFKGTSETIREEVLAGNFGDFASWPWDLEGLKVSANPILNLVKAGALIAAEIDRLIRIDAKVMEKESEVEG